MVFEDDVPEKNKMVITPGEDLSVFGLEQLSERKEILQEEIRRIDAITAQKRDGLADAESLFRKS